MRKLALYEFTFVALICIWATTPAFSQAPGFGWAMVPTPERTIKSLFWELFDKTEVWTRLVPQAEDKATTKKIQASLIFWVTFPGKALTAAEIKHGPNEVMLQAQPDPLTIVNKLSLYFLADNRERFDLTANNATFNYIYPCDGCASNAISARLDPETFRSMAASLVRSKIVKGEELGFRFVLKPADLANLRDFARYIKLPID
jgi:hypothetical protein